MAGWHGVGGQLGGAVPPPFTGVAPVLLHQEAAVAPAGFRLTAPPRSLSRGQGANQVRRTHSFRVRPSLSLLLLLWRWWDILLLFFGPFKYYFIKSPLWPCRREVGQRYDCCDHNGFFYNPILITLLIPMSITNTVFIRSGG